MADPTVLICIGAPKAGTTWLHDYLSAHPDCHFRAVKEMHYFDSRDGADGGYHRDALEARIDRLRARMRGMPIWRRRGDIRRTLRDLEAWRDIEAGANDAAYLGYMLEGRGSARVVGDITPCYGTLDRTAFARMLALSDDVRFLFILRDPVDRAWSQARMRGTRWLGAASPERAAQRVFDRFLSGKEPGFAARSDYRRTLTELLAVVPQERVHVEFYEQLFKPEALERLTDFLGIRRWPGNAQRVKNRGSTVPLDATRKGRAAVALAGQYAFCEQFFNGRLPDRWRAHMLEA